MLHSFFPRTSSSSSSSSAPLGPDVLWVGVWRREAKGALWKDVLGRDLHLHLLHPSWGYPYTSSLEKWRKKKRSDSHRVINSFPMSRDSPEETITSTRRRELPKNKCVSALMLDINVTEWSVNVSYNVLNVGRARRWRVMQSGSFFLACFPCYWILLQFFQFLFDIIQSVSFVVLYLGNVLHVAVDGLFPCRLLKALTSILTNAISNTPTLRRETRVIHTAVRLINHLRAHRQSPEKPNNFQLQSWVGLAFISPPNAAVTKTNRLSSIKQRGRALPTPWCDFLLFSTPLIWGGRGCKKLHVLFCAETVGRSIGFGRSSSVGVKAAPITPESNVKLTLSSDVHEVTWPCVSILMKNVGKMVIKPLLSDFHNTIGGQIWFIVHPDLFKWWSNDRCRVTCTVTHPRTDLEF